MLRPEKMNLLEISIHKTHIPAFLIEVPKHKIHIKMFEEAKSLGERILSGFPEAFKKSWQEAIGLWKKMLDYVSPWFKGIWNSILSLLGKEVEQRTF